MKKGLSTEIPKKESQKDRTCSAEGCKKQARSRGVCYGHYQQLKSGRALAPLKQPGRNKIINCHGYYMICAPEHPSVAHNKSARTHGYVLEHRLVMEQVLGRFLMRHENVHHINGDRLDNRPENLELWSTSQPPGQRVQDKIAWAGELLRQYQSFDCEKALAGELDAASGW